MSITAKQIAAELRWRLSNSNGEIDVFDIAYNAWSEDLNNNTFLLSASWTNLETGRTGTQSFTVTVT